MAQRVARRIAGPMIGMGVVLLALGTFAAWNVHEQQQTSAELIAREVTGMVVIEELNLKMREIRYQINLYLRTPEPMYLAQAAELFRNSEAQVQRAKQLARSGREAELIGIVARGWHHSHDELNRLSAAILELSSAAAPQGAPRPDEALVRRLGHLADDLLTREVLRPLEECIAADQQMVARTSEASQRTAQHLKIGFLLLGICGGAAGLLMGTGIARAVRKSMVRLDVTVRGVSGKLANVTGPVQFSHTGDLRGIESVLRHVETNIADVVERLQQRETEVLRSEQLARVGQIAAGLAHELRNPLMPMKMLVQSAIERGGEGGLTGRSLQILNDEITRLEQAIQEFLDFARPPQPQPTTVDVAELVRQTQELVKGRARAQGVEVRLHLPQSQLVATVDRTQLRQLLINLLLNALDVLPEGGAIDLDLATYTEKLPEPLDEPVIDSGSATEHDVLRLLTRPRTRAPGCVSRWIRLRVSDNGPGIPESLLDEIFEPFVTTKETGIGMGLANCQRIAASHQGRLTVRNRVGGGAQFELLLPWEADAPAGGETRAPTLASTVASRTTV